MAECIVRGVGLEPFALFPVRRAGHIDGERRGTAVDVAAAYETVPELSGGAEIAARLTNGEIDFVTFTSSSTVKNLVQQIGNITPLQQTKIACIGPVTADTARNFALEPDIVAETYTIDGLVNAIKEYVQ